MPDIKWIKLYTDIFDNRKIKQIEKLPEGDGILVIWLKILALAGTTNACGAIYLSKDIPYTDQMLATEFNRPLPLIQMALAVFEKFGMIEVVDDIIFVSNWEKYQNIENLEKIREQNRLRVQKFRNKQKLLSDNSASCNVTCNADVTLRNATEEDKEKEEELEEELDKELEKEKEGDIEGEGEGEKRVPIDYQSIIASYNSICKSFPKVTTLSDARKKAIRARLTTYSVNDLIRLFQKAEESSFLKGSNNRNWQANFDWLIKDTSMAKVLDGNYDDKSEYNKPSKGYTSLEEKWANA